MTADTHDAGHAEAAIQYAQQARKLGRLPADQEDDLTGATHAVEAKFITSQDPVILTADGARLPNVPLEEALELNRLRDKANGTAHADGEAVDFTTRPGLDGTVHGVLPRGRHAREQSDTTEGPLSTTAPQPRTNPLFPPCAVYGPPTMMRNQHCLVFRASSAVLSLCFLLVIIMGSFATSIPPLLRDVRVRLGGRHPSTLRKFHQLEVERAEQRRSQEAEWVAHHNAPNSGHDDEKANHCDHCAEHEEEFRPTEGGPDRLLCDVGYYARRVGLDCEIYQVQTEDGFIIELFHLYNPKTTSPKSAAERQPLSAEAFVNLPTSLDNDRADAQYPVLLIHGLLQSAGAYCCNDDASLAFYLAKSGLDVWLGNNRCGFTPTHVSLTYADPRMWTWNIRQMGVLDLPALVSRVLRVTGFPKLAPVAHSQGTTQTLVALAKEQRPELGTHLPVACLLAPAAYAGPLIGKMYFKFMRVISPALFRVMLVCTPSSPSC